MRLSCGSPRRPGQPEKPLIIVAPYSWALAYCKIDCNTPVNPKDRDVIIISHDSDIQRLRGIRLKEQPVVVKHSSPAFRIDHLRIGEAIAAASPIV